MIRLYRSGATIVLRTDSAKIEAREVRRKLIVELYAQGMTQAKIAEVFGVRQAAISKTIQERDLPVTPLFGSGEWTPDVQDQSPHTCDRCGGDSGCIRRGSRLYCAACHRTGREAMLAERRVRDMVRETAEDISAEADRRRKRSLAHRRKVKRA